MPVKACKFGGSSLADPPKFRKVKAIVEADPQRRYIVPSAPGRRHRQDQKITDLLYLCHDHARKGIAFEEVFKLIADRYNRIAADLVPTLNLQGPLEEVRQKIASTATNGDSPDYAASRGEYLNGLILAELLGMELVDPASIIHFDSDGQFDNNKTHQAMKRRLDKTQRAIIPGFYGGMPDGRIKTFSRGGSDITGAVVACAVGASVYENWTDVTGLLMANPNIIPNPRLIQTITYKELRELAYMGATVLHDEAIFPVRMKGIPVNIRGTDDPDHPGTMILKTEKVPATDAAITGIAGKKGFTFISIEKALMNTELGYGRRLLETLEVHGVSFEHMPSGIDTISVVIENSQLEGKLDQVLSDIKMACKPDTIEVSPHMALIATVGRGMSRRPGTAAKLFGALGRAEINIRMIDQGSSELNIIVGVEEKDFENSVRAIYEEFVEE